MRNFDSLTVLLVCSLSWIPVSQPLEVQSENEVTLLCSNFSSSHSQIFWFRVTKRAKLTRIASMFKPDEPASFYDGFQNGKFEMSTNISTVFLKIKQLDLLDSGLYFCGYKMQKSTVIVEATDLVVQDTFIRLPNVMSVILGVLTVFLITAIVCLTVKIKKLQKGKNLQQEESSEHLHYAAVTFRPKTESPHRPASVTEVDPDVIYSSTR
uniref:Ig-like domain-containing protein n=1 Tax=Oreochromis niloticus TaxID=8128 RepID=I3KPW0_ORENI